MFSAVPSVGIFLLVSFNPITDGVSAMFTRLLKTLSVVVLIVVLASSVSLAGVGGIHRGQPTAAANSSSADIFWTILVSLTPLAIV